MTCQAKVKEKSCLTSIYLNRCVYISAIIRSRKRQNLTIFSNEVIFLASNFKGVLFLYILGTCCFCNSQIIIGKSSLLNENLYIKKVYEKRSRNTIKKKYFDQ